MPHLVPSFRMSVAKSLLTPCVFKDCTRTTSTFIGVGGLGVDLNGYSFISNEIIINVLIYCHI